MSIFWDRWISASQKFGGRLGGSRGMGKIVNKEQVGLSGRFVSREVRIGVELRYPGTRMRGGGAAQQLYSLIN